MTLEQIRADLAAQNPVLTELANGQVRTLSASQRAYVLDRWAADRFAALNPETPPTREATLRQIRHWLIENGYYATVTGYINSIPDPITRLKAQTDFQHCSAVERSHPLVESIGAILGLTQAQVDAAFTEASKL